MNKRGQTGLTVIFALLVFWVVWIFFVAPMISVQVGIAMASGNIDGVEALVLTNLNLVIGFVSLLVLFWVAKSGF